MSERFDEREIQNVEDRFATRTAHSSRHSSGMALALDATGRHWQRRRFAQSTLLQILRQQHRWRENFRPFRGSPSVELHPSLSRRGLTRLLRFGNAGTHSHRATRRLDSNSTAVSTDTRRRRRTCVATDRGSLLRGGLALAGRDAAARSRASSRCGVSSHRNGICALP